MKWGMVGFGLGAGIPVAIGIYAVAQTILHDAAHPLGPNEARCGMPMLSGLGMILFIAPVTGMCGGAVGYLSGRVALPALRTDQQRE